VPARSRARFGSAAFGRQTFLDYCHHTVESLRLVADDVAGEVLASVGLSGAPGPAPVEPPSKELAEGYLLSALHNQHWGQPAEIVEHWIAEAVRTHPASVESLATYFATSVPAAEFWLSGGLRTGGSERMYWFLKNFSHLAVLDAEFAERALRVLDEDGREHLRRALDGVRDRLRVEASDGVNLLEPFWRERTGPPQPATVFTGERDPVSRYGFVASGEEPISLDVVLTAGPGLPDGRFELALNGRACYSAPVTADWRSHRVILPAAMLRAGANELAFAWPAAARTRQSLSSAVSAFGTGPESLDLVRLARMRLSATS
jgi:hypothetical protein